jgi:prophage tail gpP-like protein
MNQGTKGKFKVGTLLTNAIQLGSTLLAFTAAQFNQIMAAFGTVTFDRAEKVAVKAIAGAALHAGVLSWQNPESGAIVITRVVYDVTTKSTGASTTDIGTTPTSAVTASDNLIDGLDTGTANICADNFDNKGANGKSLQKLAAGKWVTFKEASGDVTGLVANAYIYYINA